MQPKSIHGADPGFRVLEQDAAIAVVRRQVRPSQVRPSLANLTDEWDTVRRRADRSIDIDFYRRRATARRAQALRDRAAWTSAGAGVLVMAAIYLALFLAAASMRAPNFHMPAAPASAASIPSNPDAGF